jgi:hypothetical protein
VTTPIGSEGMTIPGQDISSWGGSVTSTAEDVIKQAVHLYTNEHDWYKAQQGGFNVIRQLFDYETNSAVLMHTLKNVVDNLTHTRSNNFVGSILWYQGNRSTEYFSKYLELKRTTRQTQVVDTTTTPNT